MRRAHLGWIDVITCVTIPGRSLIKEGIKCTIGLVLSFIIIRERHIDRTIASVEDHLVSPTYALARLL
jgi:hypothetical protein